MTQTAATRDLHYDPVTIALHWASATLIGLLWLIGQTVDWAPSGPFLRLAAEFGVVAIDGSTVAITPLAASAVIREAGAKTEMMPPSAEMTARQLIICKLGLSAGAYAEERQAWLATRDPAEAVSSLLAVASDAAADGNFAYLTAAVEIAAGIQGDTETAWRSATGLPGIRPYAVAELNRRAGRNPQRNPLPGLEPGPATP